jgi:5-methylcytosine-specific restriction endonuclease McrA
MASDPGYVDRRRAYWREYGKARKDRYNAYRRDRYRSDSEVRLRDRVRLQIFKALRAGKGGRSSSELLGYTTEELRAHLERQFTRRMSWENYGTYWHIDHIIPVSSFVLRLEDGGIDCDAVRRCWALSNLRPLPRRENISKGGKVLFLV